MSLSPSARLGPYEILARLGAGGMGEVYRARDTRLGRDVAIKILPADLSGDPSRRARFEQEARAVAALNHPNILGLYDIGTENGIDYMVTEFVAGEILAALIERGPIPTRKLLDIAVQIADGMADAHSARITHRDLKPSRRWPPPSPGSDRVRSFAGPQSGGCVAAGRRRHLHGVAWTSAQRAIPKILRELANVPRVQFSPDGKQILLMLNGARRREEAWLLPDPPNPSHPPQPRAAGLANL